MSRRVRFGLVTATAVVLVVAGIAVRLGLAGNNGLLSQQHLPTPEATTASPAAADEYSLMGVYHVQGHDTPRWDPHARRIVIISS